jgi:hypothetical protein
MNPWKAASEAIVRIARISFRLTMCEPVTSHKYAREDRVRAHGVDGAPVVPFGHSLRISSARRKYEMWSMLSVGS